MVFNWFNRFKKEEKKPEPEPKPPEAPIETSVPQEEAEPYYMRLAKEIQRKEEEKLDELPASVPPLVEFEAPVVEPQKVEINEEIFDWQKILYGTKPTPAPVLERPPEPVVVTETPAIAESPTPVPTPSQEKVVAPLVAEPPMAPTVEISAPVEIVVEPLPLPPVTESPTLSPAMPVSEILVPDIEKPSELVIPEIPVPFIEKPSLLPEVSASPVEPVIQAVQEPPALEITTEISVPTPVETSISPSQALPPEPELETPAQSSVPFWKRILGQRSPYLETPPPAPTEISVPPTSEVPEPVLPPSVPPIPAPQPTSDISEDSEAVPFWKRILGQRPTATPPSVPEVSPTPREKPVAEPQPTQFDLGFLWSAEVLAAQGRRPEDVTLEEISWLQKLRTGLGRTRRGLVNNLKAIIGRGPLGPQELEELEEILLQADVGIGVSEKILASLQTKVRQEALPPDQAMIFLKDQLRKQVELKGDDPAKFAPLRDQLNIWLVVGVNGVGKTTTIGKLASLASRSGYRTMIAAGDTFRAGAVSQVQIWADRSKVPVISNPSPNADPASVVFDAIGAARARNIELLIVDTAGRLQNKKNLMDELAKIRRIIDKQGAGAHVESLLVLDSTTGQNGLQQAKVFTEVANLTGVVLTKLDGSAKGGIALAIVDELHLPIRFVGVGEKVDDLRPFNSYEFIEALLSDVED